MSKQNILIVVAGPSGVGKGTVCAKLFEEMETLEFSVSATTRKPRAKEVHGVNYFFVNNDRFDEMIDNGEFLEHADVFGYKYGTPKDYVMQKLESGNDVLLEIDVQGAMMVMQNYPDALFIFILPPSMESLKERLVNRATETDKQLKIRLNKAKEEIAFAKKFDYVVINENVPAAYEEVKSIIISEKCKAERNLKLIDELIKS